MHPKSHNLPMPRTLLVAHPKTTWRDWLKENQGKRDLLVLDPSLADHTAPARAYRYHEGKVREWRLVGTTDPQRNPLGLLAAAAELAPLCSPDALILTFPLRLTPVLRQIAHALATILQPQEVLVPEGSRLERQGWPVGADTIELPAAFPPLVRDAQRRARWIELIESTEHHQIELADVTLQGARLGSGTRLAHKDFAEYGEVSGGVLHVVSDNRLEDDQVARAMDLAHASKISIVSPSSYQGLLCSFAHQNGDDFGYGIVESFDPERYVMRVRNTAVPPAPVRILKLGNIRLQENGQELPPLPPWHL